MRITFWYLVIGASVSAATIVGGLLLNGSLLSDGIPPVPVEAVALLWIAFVGPLILFGLLLTTFRSLRKLERVHRATGTILNEVLEALPLAVFWKNRQGTYLGCNSVFAKLIGQDQSQAVIGKCDDELLLCEHDAEVFDRDNQDVIENLVTKRNAIELLRAADDATHTMKVYKAPLLDERNQAFAVLAVYEDITERQKTEAKLRKEIDRSGILLELYESAPQMSDKQLYDFALEQAVRLTDSSIGFLHLISDDQKEVILTTWNSEALNDCQAPYNVHYPIEQAGNWVDCIHQRRAVIYNDFASSPNRKGLPEGHVPLRRFMSVPVIDGDKVRVIFGVGNKAEPYDDLDSTHIQLVANELHKIILQRRAQAALRDSERDYQQIFNSTSDALLIHTHTGTIIDMNERAIALFGLDRHTAFALPARSIYPPEMPWFDIEGNSPSAQPPQLFDWLHHRSDGSEVWLEASFLAREIDGRILVIASIRDISDRKHTENELRRYRDNLEELVAIRTAALERSQKEMERLLEEANNLNRAMVGRERRIIELKEEINVLCQKHALPPPYPPVWEETR